VDALHINAGWHEASVPQIIASVPRGAFAYLARGFKNLLDVPVISSHRINEPVLAGELIADGMCDMVSMGRGLIADPYLPEKVRTGRENEVIHCIACAQGCFDRITDMKSITCLCNPRAGREKETRITRVDTPKKVMVIGGGAAGMSSALSASERGHNVTLYEKDDRLGGQLYLAAAPPGREEFAQLAKDLEYRLAISDVNVCIGQQVDEALIDVETPDVVILATGATPISLTIPGANLPHVVQAWDVLRNKVHTGLRVVIIGGGRVMWLNSYWSTKSKTPRPYMNWQPGGIERSQLSKCWIRWAGILGELPVGRCFRRWIADRSTKRPRQRQSR